jgi:hypothetical protein
MASSLLVLAALLLAVPGVFVGAKGLAAIRTRSAVVQGRTVAGTKAIGAGLLLLGWAAGTIALAVLLLAVLVRR